MDEKFERWNLKSIDDSPSSLFLPLLRAKTLLSWQMNNSGCKLHITFFAQTRESVIVYLNFKTKLVYFLSFLISVSTVD